LRANHHREANSWKVGSFAAGGHAQRPPHADLDLGEDLLECALGVADGPAVGVGPERDHFASTAGADAEAISGQTVLPSCVGRGHTRLADAGRWNRGVEGVRHPLGQQPDCWLKNRGSEVRRKFDDLQVCGDGSPPEIARPGKAPM